MKKILGLDLGTNSIGWAVVDAVNDDTNNNEKLVGIEGAGSRIIPMDASILGDFDKGNTISQTAERTGFRRVHRLRERHLLRRERLHRVLDLLGFLPEHYAREIDRYGKILTDTEPKLPWKKDETGKYVFIFQDSFNEILKDFALKQPEIVADNKKIPYDWTIYYLRKKALSEKISKEELSWLLLNFNQKRGYYQLRGKEDENEENPNKSVKYYSLKVISVTDSGEKKGNDIWYNVTLENNLVYRRTSNIPLDWEGKTKDFIITTDLNEDGTPKMDRDGKVKCSIRAPKEDDWTLVKEKTESAIIKSNKTVGSYIYDTLLENPCQKINGGLIRTIERKHYKDELRQILDKQKTFHEELQNNDLYLSCLNALYLNNDVYRNSIKNNDFTYLFLDNIIFYQRPLKSKKSLISNCPFEIRFDKDGNKYPVKAIPKSHPLFQEFRLWQFISNLRIYQRERKVEISSIKNGGIDGQTENIKKLETDIDVTNEFLPDEESFTKLFDWLNDRLDITQNILLGSFFKIKKTKGGDDTYPYRWNYVEDKKYPCNETRATILTLLEKAKVNTNLLTRENEELLWQIIYSISDKQEFDKAVSSFANAHNLNDDFIKLLCKIKPFDKDYGSYSSKAIKKLLPLMRMGKYWNADAIDEKTKQRIDKIMTGEYDQSIQERVRKMAINLTDISHFKGLPIWLACYIVYNRHSESKDITKWESPSDIDNYLMNFKQYSLRNPIVEQVVTETLRTVRDIWKQFGQIDEIHVELGRSMKNPKDKRANITKAIEKNENTNMRIKALLLEFMNPDFEIEGVRPYSVSQQDILHIYEDGVFQSASEIPKDVTDILLKFDESDIKKRPTHSEVLRYKLWLDQKYQSPYTGKIIPLSKLFTPAYEIEHIIPQSRYFDDSFNNKVICESEVNKLKDNDLGYEFVKKHHDEVVRLGLNEITKIFSVEAYEKFVKEHYHKNNNKKSNLLLDDIPDKFIERQMNDSRYISKVIKKLLSNVVREKDEQEETSKNLIPCSGGITDRLKKDWGITDVWNSIILPRFERLNQKTVTSNFTTQVNGHIIPSVPFELQKGFSKKRIDHRHHAMDAIVIACSTRSHVNLLNNEAAQSKNRANRYQLSRKLRRYEKVVINGQEREISQEFLKPWETFTQDVRNVLSDIIVSFKQNLRIINKTKNLTQYFDKDKGKKQYKKQDKGNMFAIRKSMHKATIFGKVNLRKEKNVRLAEALKRPQYIVDKEFKNKIKELLKAGFDEKKIADYFKNNKEIWSDTNLSKITVYFFTNETGNGCNTSNFDDDLASKDKGSISGTLDNMNSVTNDNYNKCYATRFCNDLVSVFKGVKDKLKALDIINSITDTGIQKILINHLKETNDDPTLAFSPDGIDKMNQNIKRLNDGKNHQPIYKVRIYEIGNKYPIGKKGNKGTKFVEAEKGTNLFFAVYKSIVIDTKTGIEKEVRSYDTISLNDVIKREINCLTPVPEINKNGDKLLFWISPNDLVYLPTNEELQSGSPIHIIDRDRIYKFVSANNCQGFFIKHSVANCIIDKYEFSSLNKMERAVTGEMIKETCIPIKVDRLGNII